MDESSNQNPKWFPLDWLCNIRARTRSNSGSLTSERVEKKSALLMSFTDGRVLSSFRVRKGQYETRSPLVLLPWVCGTSFYNKGRFVGGLACPRGPPKLQWKSNYLTPFSIGCFLTKVVTNPFSIVSNSKDSEKDHLFVSLELIWEEFLCSNRAHFQRI